MQADYDANAPKRPVNLSLNSDLVARARGMTGNLSEVVEGLLAEFLAEQQTEKHARAESDVSADTSPVQPKLNRNAIATSSAAVRTIDPTVPYIPIMHASEPVLST